MGNEEDVKTLAFKIISPLAVEQVGGDAEGVGELESVIAIPSKPVPSDDGVEGEAGCFSLPKIFYLLYLNQPLQKEGGNQMSENETLTILDRLKVLLAKQDGIGEEMVTAEYALDRLRRQPHWRTFSLTIEELSQPRDPEDVERRVQEFLKLLEAT